MWPGGKESVGGFFSLEKTCLRGGKGKVVGFLEERLVQGWDDWGKRGVALMEEDE